MPLLFAPPSLSSATTAAFAIFRFSLCFALIRRFRRCYFAAVFLRRRRYDTPARAAAAALRH